MRFLGIDYGTKRVGIAISDEEGKLAFPKEVLMNDDNVLTKLGKIIESENITEIVIGESTDLVGKDNKVAKEIENLIKELTVKFFIPIHKQKEFFTSVEARRYGNSDGDVRKSVDASAAALILQRYLDKINN
ncbi:MAG: Holliday junction resolvase RuvX [Patescibacteria group bacterium]